MSAEPTRCRVLIVEDEATIARNCFTFFEMQGHAVDVAHDGAAAIARLTSEIFDVVANQRARLNRAMATIDAAASTLESLHALSLEQRGTSERFDLHTLVEDAWSSLAHDGTAPPLRLVNDVPVGAIVVSDRHALLTILRNLLRNAAEHAGRATCVVRRDGERLTITDNGPGTPAADLPFVFERCYRGRLKDAPGAPPADRGLGLAIATQSAEVNGWGLSVESTPGSGTCFSLHLLPSPVV